MNKFKGFAGIVLGAGFGTRLMPFTEDLPKPLVPLLNRTPLWHQISLLLESGISEVYVNIHYKPDLMKRYLKSNFKRLKFTIEPEILGTGGGIRNIIKHFKIEKPVVVLNGDTVSSVNLKEMIKFFIENRCDALMLLKADKKINFENAVFADKELNIKYIKTKPQSPRGLHKYRFLGVHILKESVFDYLPLEGCINKITYPRLIKEGLKVMGYEVKIPSFDIGDPESLYKTNFGFLKGRYTFSSVLTTDYIKKIKDSDGNIIGKRCKIINSRVRDSIISDDVVIEDSVVIESLIFPKTHISKARLKRCIANDKNLYIIKPRQGGTK